MIYWVLLILTAILAYVLGSMSSVVIASNYVFHANLRRLGKGNVAFSNFRRIYGFKGMIILLLVEVLKDIIPIIVGGWLLGIKGHAEAGRLFAAFCLIMGRMYPVFYNLHGTHALVCLIVTAFFMDASMGIAALAAAGLIIWFTRYASLATVVAAIVTMITAVLLIDDRLLLMLGGCITAVIVIRHIPALSRILNGTETRISFEEDISYKFDQRF